MSLVIIPARLQSTRLPKKALLSVGRLKLVTQCLKRANEAKVGPVFVATDSDEIKQIVEEVGGNVVMTSPDLPSGSDRVQAAAAILDPYGREPFVINMQGDLPFISPEIITAVVAEAFRAHVDVVTPIHTSDHVLASKAKGFWDFERTTLSRHIGIYVWRRTSLDKYVNLPVSSREIDQGLEQLRAIDNRMIVKCVEVGTFPVEINTISDLQEVRHLEGYLK